MTITTDREEEIRNMGAMQKVKGIGKSIIQGGIILGGFAFAVYSMSFTADGGPGASL